MKDNISPESAAPHTPDELLIYTFVKLDKTALGVAFGVLLGLGIFIATLFLVIKGDGSISAIFGLLSHFFIGYSVTIGGSFVGLIYGFITGFILGWLVAFLRNLFLNIYLSLIKFKIALSSIDDYVDGP